MARKKWFLFSAVLVGSFLAIAIGIPIPASGAPQSATWSQKNALNPVAEINRSGSVYRDLEGRTMNYSHSGFGGLELAFRANILKWRGFDFVYFDTVVSQVEPQAPKVTEYNYFLSWSTRGGTDNAVKKLKVLTVYAHLWSDPDSVDEYSDSDQIHGQILWRPFKNSPFQAPLIDAHATAIAELSNTAEGYKTEDGSETLPLFGPQTHVSVNSGSSQTYRTHVTKMGDGIFIISWLGEPTTGDHIVVDTNTMLVLDHVSSVGQRGEQLLQLTCFAPVEAR